MQLAIVNTRAMLGMQAPLVTVEVHLSYGLPGFAIVGLPEAAVRESKDRVRSAIINSHFEFPDYKIIVNLAPGDLPKHGSRFDLAIAIGILAASEQIPKDAIHDMEFVGELALTGALRAVKGILPFAIQCKAQKHTLILPKENETELNIVKDLSAFTGNSLLDVCHWLKAEDKQYLVNDNNNTVQVHYAVDYADVKGQAQAKKALEIAAAGGHNVLMVGSPGSGKTMLASRLMTILPDLKDNEALEVAAIYSLSNTVHEHLLKRPFRTPHHTTSHVALVGGGRPPKPGEISLAHKGVLFLDELPEFSRHSLETLRQPLESGSVQISRAGCQAEFPADFLLIAAMNPCPCGHHGDPQKHCTCTPDQVKRYQSKISVPLLDRIDIHIEVNAIDQDQWFQGVESEQSASIKPRVVKACDKQLQRQQKMNYALTNAELHKHCQLAEDAQTMLEKAAVQYKLSMRAIHRILKVARTIADLADSQDVLLAHLSEALSLRMVWRV